MNRKMFWLFSFMITGLTIFGAASAQAAGAKQEICHFPPGNPANFHTITVSTNAVSAHVSNHNDLVGSCLANCETICDDGNACTIDVVPDLNQCICAAEPRPQVDCSDGNSCTADSCDPANGTCVNDPAPNDGNVCDDDNSNTNGEACFNGSCDPPCPCFNGGNLVANGAVLACGSNFPGFPNLTGMIWANGAIACSGANCAAGPALTCVITNPFVVSPVTAQEDQNCRALLLNYCASPNLTLGVENGEASSTPFFVEN